MRTLVLPTALVMVACASPATEDAGLDAGLDARRPDAADVLSEGVVCEGERLADESIGCRRMNVPSGLICTRYGCQGEDGGADLTGCCVLMSS